MKARPLAELQVEGVRTIERLGDRTLVATDDAVFALAGESLSPILTSLDVIAMRGGWALTPDSIRHVDGASMPLAALRGERPSTFVPVDDGAVVAVSDPHRPYAARVARIARDGRSVW